MRRIIIALAAVLAAAAFAQGEAAPGQLSILDALRRVEEASESVAIARAQRSRADAEQVRARSEWLPQVNASVSYDRLLVSEYDALFSGGGGGGGEQPVPDFLKNLPFGRKNTYRVGLNLQQNLFSGFRSVARGDMATAGIRTADLGLAQARAQAMLEAVQAYYDAVLSARLLAIADASLKQAQQTAENVRLGRQVGSKPEFDLLRAQVTAENQKPVVLQRRMERDSAMLRLQQLLELPLGQSFQLTTTLDEPSAVDLPAATRQIVGLGAPAPEAPRVTVAQAGETVKVRDALVRTAFAGHLPSVNLAMNYGLVAYPEPAFPGFEEFRANWTVGLSLQVPLFTGFRVTGDVQAAQADLEEARARLRQAEELARLDSRQVAEQLEAAEASWRASAGVVEQAKKARGIAEIRYKEGISTQLELSDAQLLLDQAEANRARAARDFQVARVRAALIEYLPVPVGGLQAGGFQAGGGGSTGVLSGGSSLGGPQVQFGAPAQGSGAPGF